MQKLERTLGTWGAASLGLGSIVGTGAYVSLGFGAELAHSYLIGALALAALLALFNGLSSAALAAKFPVSGGTYEYAFRTLGPKWGFAAGWLFLIAKSASAAAAALSVGAILLNTFHISQSFLAHKTIALGVLVCLSIPVLLGMQKTSRLNALLVLLSLGALLTFVIFALFAKPCEAPSEVAPLTDIFKAAALLFVAYTGYGRIATLGEEVREPEKTIPRAVCLTLVIAWVLYSLVGSSAMRVVGSHAYGNLAGQGSPLPTIARETLSPWLGHFLAVGAVAAMLGVLLNLILGISRVVLAMGRRGDLPPAMAQIIEGTPRSAILFSSSFIAAGTVIGGIGSNWVFSALTVLVYYALTNAAAFTLGGKTRWFAILGLVGCLSLVFWIEPRAWVLGISILVAGFLVRALIRFLLSTPSGRD